MDKIEHIIKFDDKTLKAIDDLTLAIKENTKIYKDGNPEEFTREICANICANILMGTSFGNF